MKNKDKLKVFRWSLEENKIVKVKYKNRLIKGQIKYKIWFWIFSSWEFLYYENKEEAEKENLRIIFIKEKNIYPIDYK